MGIQYPGSTNEIRCVTQDHIATITINRPDRKNAVTGAMWETLAKLTGELGHDNQIRVVIIKGQGSDFSAGADIGEFDALRGDAESAKTYEASNSRAFAAIRNCPVPVIAAIAGTCFGGGFGIAAACDLRIASPDAVFAVPAARLGLAYPHDAMGDIVDACGTQMARWLIYTGARMSAKDALQAGFLLAIHEKVAIERATGELAAMIARNAPLSVKASKLAIDASLSGEGTKKDAAARLGAATYESSDYAEGRAAFREKRNPRFTGK